MTTKTIKIATDFTDTPLGRYPSDGPFSGQRFRDEFLAPALRANDEVIVDIDNAEGYGSGFLEEAFGGLIRIGFTLHDIQKKLKFIFTDRGLIYSHQSIWDFIYDADFVASAVKKQPGH